MSKPTPGPWFATTRQGSWDWVVASEADPNIEICQMFHDGTNDNERGQANARLVAAAPDLLAALEAIAGGHIPASILNPALAAFEATGDKLAFKEMMVVWSQDTARAALRKAAEG